VNEVRLARAASRGDQDAFGRLVLDHALTARRVAYSVLGDWDEAEDVVQDAALSAWQAVDRYDPSRAFRPWFLRIVSNAALDHARRRKVRRTEMLSEAEPHRGPMPDRVTDQALLRGHLDRAIGELPERQRIAVTMFDLEGFSHAEIAESLGVPEGTVRSYVFHARRALRRALTPLTLEGTT
jgi:RNA polymerase sigma-70 factor (ECF subfamily)